jgi:hypothetical protein
LSISSDWEALCKALGVKYRETDWPARNTFPNRFFTDRGEGISEKSNVVVLGPGMEVTTAPRASPRRKCRVEGNFFYTIGVFLKDLMGAYRLVVGFAGGLVVRFPLPLRCDFCRYMHSGTLV